ncbi:ras-related protein Rab-26 isoform X2 [Octodon degus]|uniref:small monomeric GTPase n=1 Tax=Octodon degus TaxID=10160 RepID=A0A6P6E4T0_OCTDE|nr:ras-related protein Rab-26 isoform X2 [Octodon degus]
MQGTADPAEDTRQLTQLQCALSAHTAVRLCLEYSTAGWASPPPSSVRAAQGVLGHQHLARTPPTDHHPSPELWFHHFPYAAFAHTQGLWVSSFSEAGKRFASWMGRVRPPPDQGRNYVNLAVVMLVGDSGVGKTCLLVRFKDGAFLAGTFISTVGIDFRNKVLDVDGMKVKLQIWDTAGQERFRSVTHAYYRDAHALLLLYDVTNKTSFDNIQAWLTEIQEYAQDDVVLMLLGNKVDSTQERAVKREDGEKLAKLVTAVCRSMDCPTWKPVPRQGSTLTWPSLP